MRSRALGFWGVAGAFTATLAFTTVPTPLWSLFAQRDGFSRFVVTVVFAAYAVGVVVSLFLAGHVSDWYGRQRVLAPALLLNMVAAAVFVLWPEVPGLLLARVLSGLGIGALTATATAWLVDLHPDRRRAETVAAAANLGGLGAGALVSGILAQWAGHPLTVPFLVFIGVLGLALVLVASAPETRPPTQRRPAYRPQRISVPAESRGQFFAAATAGAITFALFGLLTSLAPSFLSGTLHHSSRALAGATSFAVFAAAALSQVLAGAREPRALLVRGACDVPRARAADARGLASAPKPQRVSRRRARHRRRQRLDVQRRDRNRGRPRWARTPGGGARGRVPRGLSRPCGAGHRPWSSHANPDRTVEPPRVRRAAGHFACARDSAAARPARRHERNRRNRCRSHS